MPRAIPILIIVGLALYSFFDVLQTSDDRIRRYPKPFWLVMALVPVLGAALWFMVGRPKRGRGGYGPPRVIHLKSGGTRPAAPDDDPAFLKRLEEEAWRRRRKTAKDAQPPQTPADGRTDQPGPRPDPPADPSPPPGPAGPAPSTG